MFQVKKSAFCFFFILIQFSLFAQKNRCYKDKDSHYQTEILIQNKNIFIENSTSFASFHSFGKIKNKSIVYALDSTFKICFSVFSKKEINPQGATIIDLELEKGSSFHLLEDEISINQNQKNEKQLRFPNMILKDGEFIQQSDFKLVMQKDKLIYRYTSTESLKVKNIHGKTTNSNHNYFYAKIYTPSIKLWEGHSRSLKDRVFVQKNQAFFWNDLIKKELTLNPCECSTSILKLREETSFLLF